MNSHAERLPCKHRILVKPLRHAAAASCHIEQFQPDRYCLHVVGIRTHCLRPPNKGSSILLCTCIVCDPVLVDSLLNSAAHFAWDTLPHPIGECCTAAMLLRLALANVRGFGFGRFRMMYLPVRQGDAGEQQRTMVGGGARSSFPRTCASA